jgi:hypothetical protein
MGRDWAAGAFLGRPAAASARNRVPAARRGTKARSGGGVADARERASRRAQDLRHSECTLAGLSQCRTERLWYSRGTPRYSHRTLGVPLGLGTLTALSNGRSRGFSTLTGGAYLGGTLRVLSGGPLADLADDGDDVAGHELRRVDARPRALVGLAAAVDLTGAAPLTVRTMRFMGTNSALRVRLVHFIGTNSALRVRLVHFKGTNSALRVRTVHFKGTNSALRV